MKSRLRIFCIVSVLILVVSSSALAYQSGTLYSGQRGEAVRTMQAALIKLGYLGGTADGIFGTNTEKAVKKFQRANKLTADGLAGSKTLELLYKKAGTKAGDSTSASSSSTAPAAAGSSASAAPSNSAASGTSAASASSSSGIFGGNYSTMRLGYTGSRVSALQKQLISLGYLSGKADGKYGAKTGQAVISFQKASKLTADGLAGKQTLLALEKANVSSASTAQNSSASGSDPSSDRKASGPSGSQVQLLHWFNDVKPALRNGQTLYIYEPSSGRGWNLRICSSGRHCDAEPCTAEDTASMLAAFGGENTWSQKAVYVKLPSGLWTIGSTHDMPHLSGSVNDNNFDGHLCVHFLRTMSEAQQNDPSYGVANQNTIRAFWKSLTGETISD